MALSDFFSILSDCRGTNRNHSAIMRYFGNQARFSIPHQFVFQFSYMSDTISPKCIIETERLVLRELSEADFPGVSRVFQDREATRFYDRVFTEEEIRQWFDIQFRSYREQGFGIWAVVQKISGKMIGHAGISVRHHDGSVIYEIGYMFEKEYWGNGYATEAAMACRDMAFDVFGLERVCSIIRFNNMASRAVARKNGMRIAEMIYRVTAGKVVPHYIYSMTNPRCRTKPSAK